MKLIQLSEETISKINEKKEMWEDDVSHSFVSNYTLERSNEKNVKELLDNQIKWNNIRTLPYDMFGKDVSSNLVIDIYNNLCKYKTDDLVMLHAGFDDTLEVIHSDIATRIVLYYYTENIRDFSKFNNQTRDILMDLMINNTQYMWIDDEFKDILLNKYNIDIDLKHQFTNYQYHIFLMMEFTTAIYEIMTQESWTKGDLYVSKATTLSYIMSDFKEIGEVIPHVYNTDFMKDAIFWTFTDWIEDYYGYNDKVAEYYDIKDPSVQDEIEVIVTQMFDLITDQLINQIAQDIYGSSFQQFVSLRSNLFRLLTGVVDNEDNGTSLIDYIELLYLTASEIMITLFNEMYQEWTNSGFEVDCFHNSVCKKIIRIAYYLMTKDFTIYNHNL